MRTLGWRLLSRLSRQGKRGNQKHSAGTGNQQRQPWSLALAAACQRPALDSTQLVNSASSASASASKAAFLLPRLFLGPGRSYLPLHLVFVVCAKPFVSFNTLLSRPPFLPFSDPKPFPDNCCVVVRHWRHPHSPNGTWRLLTTKNLNKTRPAHLNSV